MSERSTLADVGEEFVGVDFGDARLGARLQRIATATAARPGDSFPQIAGSDGELEGVYRFLSNERVNAGAILAPHLAATEERSRAVETLIVHDTTNFLFGGSAERNGLGRLHRVGGAQGFFGHFALAVAGDGTRRPLGLVGLQAYVRKGRPLGRHVSGWRRSRRNNKEIERWSDLVGATAPRYPKAVHVMDREADSFHIYHHLIGLNARFVIRMREGAMRIVCRDGVRLSGLRSAFGGRAVLTRTVPLSGRPPSKLVELRSKIHPPREERLARLEVRTAAVNLPRPHPHRFDHSLPEFLALNLVCVQEIGTPPGTVPVTWILATTESIATKKDVERVVDIYRSRWVIEEFFKALKTGCAFERRQLESLHSLTNALAVFCVIAWRMLVLRTAARTCPDALASTAITDRQLRVLRSLGKMKLPGIRVSKLRVQATAQDALLAIAKLGGHIRNNGPPGWLTLRRGFDAMLLLELGWRARDGCDQS